MKILNLIQCTNLGGMEQATLRLMTGLQEAGHDGRLLSLNPLGTLAPLLAEAGIPARGLPYLGAGGWRSFPALKRTLRQSEADALIMTGHNLLAMLALGEVARSRRLLAVHFHHAGVKPACLWRLIYRLACRRFQAIVFPSDFVRQEAEAIYPEVSRLSLTIRNPIHLPRLPLEADRLAARARLGIPSDALVIGNAGWLIARKRFDVFLEVARRVLDELPSTVFVIAGDGPERERLQEQARGLGIAGSVRWLGWQGDLQSFYHSLDSMLFNSDWDALGLTPLEAMSYGIPVVASVVNGGLKEIINSDQVGYLLDQHDVELMAALLVSLYRDPGRRSVGLRGRWRIAETCSVEGCLRCYQYLLSGRLDLALREAASPRWPGSLENEEEMHA